MVSASDSAADVAQRVEEQAGLPHGESRLLLNGVELEGSLASYGVRPGAVLELVPHEPGVPAALPPGSPLLSSPQHELARALAGSAGWRLCSAHLSAAARADAGGDYAQTYIVPFDGGSHTGSARDITVSPAERRGGCAQFHGFQAARAGLKKHAPQLATSGTGGSYFIADVQVVAPQCVVAPAAQLFTSLQYIMVVVCEEELAHLVQGSFASPTALMRMLQRGAGAAGPPRRCVQAER